MLSDTPFEVPAHLLERARNTPRVAMAVVGADHPVPLESARQGTEAGLIEPVLIGDAGDIGTAAREIGWDISDVRVVDAPGETKAPETAVALARGDEVRALMKGQVHTDSLMAPVVARETGLRTGRRLSHIFHMTVPGSDRALMITDGAVNVAPNEDTLVHIVNNAVDMAHALGHAEPKVALLSGTESVIDSMPTSVTAAAVVRRAQAGEVTGALISGPLSFDLAVSPAAVRVKGMDDPVAGQADILAVPNIEMGNGLFKMLVYFRSGLAAGVVMGAKVPIVLTSRADPPEARFAATAIAAIVADATGG